MLLGTTSAPMPTGKAILDYFYSSALGLKNKGLQSSNPRLPEKKSTVDLPCPVLTASAHDWSFKVSSHQTYFKS